MFADAHCHLDDFKQPAAAVQRAKALGVGVICSASVDLESMKANLALSKKFHEVRCCLGVHPCTAASATESQIEGALSFLEENIGKAAALGESGLDFNCAVTAEKQRLQGRVFSRQIEMAEEHSLGIVVHSRRARNETLEAIETASVEKVLLHWFFCPEKRLDSVLRKGLFISVGPSVISAKHFEPFVKALPLENLLLETDAPVSFEGKPAEPCWIPRVAARVAVLKGLPLEVVEGKTTQNALEFFSERNK